MSQDLQPMGYELAKRLHDAGFPNARVKWCYKDHFHIKDCELFPAPMLDELIEAVWR